MLGPCNNVYAVQGCAQMICMVTYIGGYLFVHNRNNMFQPPLIPLGKCELEMCSTSTVFPLVLRYVLLWLDGQMVRKSVKMKMRA